MDSGNAPASRTPWHVAQRTLTGRPSESRCVDSIELNLSGLWIVTAPFLGPGGGDVPLCRSDEHAGNVTPSARAANQAILLNHDTFSPYACIMPGPAPIFLAAAMRRRNCGHALCLSRPDLPVAAELRAKIADIAHGLHQREPDPAQGVRKRHWTTSC